MRACMYVGRCVHDDCAWRGEFTGLEPVRATSKESRSLHVQYLHTYLHVLDICVTTLIKKKATLQLGGEKARMAKEQPSEAETRSLDGCLKAQAMCCAPRLYANY